MWQVHLQLKVIFLNFTDANIYKWALFWSYEKNQYVEICLIAVLILFLEYVYQNRPDLKYAKNTHHSIDSKYFKNSPFPWK